MIDKGLTASGEVDLRALAESRLDAQTPPGLRLPLSGHETLRLLHELQVHKIELEQQNAEIQQARDEVEALLEKYTDLYDFAPIGYFTLDNTGSIDSANLSGASLLGTERAYLRGRAFRLFIADTSRQLFSEFLRQVFARQGKNSCVVQLKPEEDGSRRFVQLEAIAYETSPACRVAVVDITGQKLGEERITLLNNELEERVRARTAELESSNDALQTSYKALDYSYKELETFSYAVAHDLRTPLRSMNGFSRVILEDYSGLLDVEGKQLLNRIGEAAERMGQLVDGILSLSGLTRAKLSCREVALSSLVREIVDTFRGLEPEREVDVVVSDDVVVCGDPQLLRQVLENLLNNAWKYTHKRSDARIEFGTERLREETVYFVRDNGIGFDMRHTAKLFKPFERLHGMQEYEGIGIGLATVQRIVSRHGGRIWAEAAPEKGAAFYFTL